MLQYGEKIRMKLHTIKGKYSKLFEKILKHKECINCMGILLFKIILDIVYALVMCRVYEYQNFTMNFSVIRLLIAYLTVFIFIPYLVGLYSQKSCSAICVQIISLLYFIPMTTMYEFGMLDSVYYFFGILYWAIFLIAQYKIPILYFKTSTGHQQKWIFNIMIFVCVLFVLYLSGKYTGFRLLFSITDVYGIRAEAAAYNMSNLEKYFLGMLPVIISILLVYTLYKRKIFATLILMATQFLVYSFAGQKSVFFLLIMILIGYLFYKENRIACFPWIFSSIGLLGAGEYLINKTSWIYAFTYNRNMFLPNKISYEIYQFFQNNPTDIFRNGIMGKLGMDSPYQQSITRIIGQNFYSQENNANNGILGDVYSNLGVIGIFVLPIVLILIFRLIDSVTANIGKEIVVGICVYFSIMFINASWSTILLTNGLLVACFLLYFFPRKNTGDKKCGIVQKKNTD